MKDDDVAAATAAAAAAAKNRCVMPDSDSMPMPRMDAAALAVAGVPPTPSSSPPTKFLPRQRASEPPGTTNSGAQKKSHFVRHILH
jgi:hypothetical protein